MVRLEYGFNGYQVPPTPRAARSARKRCLFKRKADDSHMCPFDLLATVAGKLLSDGEHSPHTANTSGRKDNPASVENPIDKEDNVKPLEQKSLGRGCYERKFLITELVSDAPDPHYCPSNELSRAPNDETSGPASGITSSGSDSSDKTGCAEQLVNDDCKLRLGIFSPSVDVELSGFRVSANSGSEEENRKQLRKVGYAETRHVSIGNKPSICGSGDPDNRGRKPPTFVDSFNSVKFPFRKDDSPSGSFPVSRDHVKLVTKDYDENSSECNELSTRNKAYKPLPHFGDRNFRKFPASKECKITPDVKDGQRYNADVERCNYLNRKTAFKSQRSLRDYPFKKRKLFGSNSVSNFIERDGISNVPENDSNGVGIGSSPTVPAAMVTPTSASGGHTSFHSINTQVKLKIKSFRVPELLIEMPETASVGSLKKTVMEAITSVLGGGLRVGVVLQGKKLRDDSKTLLQAGISQDNKMDYLGFSLEPNPAPAPLRFYHETRRPVQLTPDKPQPLARCPPPPIIIKNSIHRGNLDSSSPDVACSSSFNNFIESDHDSAPSPTGILFQRRNMDSKALVLSSSATKPDALAVMPLRKCKRSESAQRRIRRPFTVAEVEALVQAVEELGTGRWRDVKLRAFDNAKHRTYVDLKDKWKTLVHTARISPQQRRGEPVPQELLDRVLTAHAYWSQQQAKHQMKAQPDTCLLL